MVRQSLEDARGRIAHWLGAKPAEVIFTAGATESINLAIHGVVGEFTDGHVVTVATEHDAVLGAARRYSHTIVPVLPDGSVHLLELKKAITDKTVVVSVAMANNEIGTIQPLREVLAAVAEARHLRQLKNNSRPIYIHTDASQAGCYLDIHASRLGADLLTLNGAKIYGPKQTGALFIKSGVRLRPLVMGGGQEFGLRSGTENVAGAVGLAAALDIAQAERKEAIVKMSALRDELQRELMAAFSYIKVNGNLKKRLPNNLHVSWPGLDGERLLMLLDEHGIMASTGSACAANKQTASHVLTACGYSDAVIQGSLRLSLGRTTTRQQIKSAGLRIISTVRSMQ